MHLVTDNYSDLWSSKQSLFFDVPACSLQQRVSSSRQTAEVSHGRARDETGAARSGELEELA